MSFLRVVVVDIGEDCYFDVNLLLFLPVDSTKHFIDLIVVVVVDGGDDDDDVERGLMEYRSIVKMT